MKIAENPNSETLEAKKSVETGEPDVDTAELANEILQNQEEMAKMNALGKKRDGVAYQEALQSIQTDNSPEKQGKSQAEHQAQRAEITQKAMQMVIDNLQSKLEKKGVAKWFGPSQEELNKGINGLKNIQSENYTQFSPEYLFADGGSGVLADKSVREAVNKMIDELDPEDQKFFHNKQVEDQVGNRLSNVSAG